MKRRLLPILMTLVLVCALPIWAAFVTSGDVTNPLVCTAWADTAEGERNSGTTQETFTEVTDETTLKKAVADGKSVRMTQDITLTSSLCIEKAVTLDMDGHMLTRMHTDKYDMVVIRSDATLTLIDSNTGNLQHRFNAGETGWTKAADNATGDGIVTVTGGVIYGDAGSSIDTCGIKILDGKLEMYGGNIVGIGNGYTHAYGGGVYVSDKCTFNMYGGSIKGCYVWSDGGGVYVAAGGTFTMSGSSTIEGCNASSGGGVYSAGTFTMRGNSCIRNCIYRSGAGSGGVHNMGTFNLNGGSIEGTLSKQSDDGTGFAICNDGTLQAMIPISCDVDNRSTISKGTFTGLVYNASGGTISDGKFQGNVFNCGTISGGEFSVGEVRNAGGHITKGTFNVPVVNEGGWIYGGTFLDTVTNKTMIFGGEFRKTVNNTGEICGGNFYGTVNNDGRIGSDLSKEYDGGTFYGTVTGSGTINAKAYETVTFASEGGTAVDSQTVLRGQKVAKPTDDPTKSGHTFTGWYLGDKKYNFDTPVTAPLTLTAKWEKVPSSGGYYYYQPTTDTKTDGTKGSPKTADPGAALYGALALLSLTGMVALNGKKR